MPETLSGAELRQMREARNLDQQAFADLLNDALDRKYDKAKISRWETGAERVPQLVAQHLKATGGNPTAIPSVKAGPALVMAVINQKGGVAKTVSVVNIAHLLAEAGKRVLVIDCDAQGSATIHLGIYPADRDAEKLTLNHVLFHRAAIDQVIMSVCDGTIDLLPSSISLARADSEINHRPNGALILRAKIQEVKERYDFILLDCPPHLSQITVSALNASDLVLIPSQTETLSLMGIPLLLETLADVQALVNPALRVLGILPTLYDARRTQDRERLTDLEEMGRQNGFRVFPPVSRSVIYPKGVNDGRPALAIDPKAAGAESYQAVADALVDLCDAQRSDLKAKESTHA
ncbi:AAA family ATPase [Azospirillum sp. SYSU D00513]|uniref:AAA family ATPase n=1 Tax=Azospirillum sp. SYSU D00513 TaxID=2812561 RepID=UPI001A957E4D|nr:AAA family ATPase [Azospirillum sp. SYSU D00513]